MTVNADGPANLARACGRHGARLVHVSTDYVFDGRKTSPYLPEDPIDPQSVYGRSKAEGERRIRDILDDYAIVRTSWLFAAGGKNFVKTILKLASEREELRVVTDQVGRPTYAADLAEALVVVGEQSAVSGERKKTESRNTESRKSMRNVETGGGSQPSAVSGQRSAISEWRSALNTQHLPLGGTYHFCNAGACSWFEFATEIVRMGGRRCRVLPTTTGEFPRPAKRPAYSVLSTESLERDFGIRPRDWREALAVCVREMESRQ